MLLVWARSSQRSCEYGIPKCSFLEQLTEYSGRIQSWHPTTYNPVVRHRVRPLDAVT